MGIKKHLNEFIRNIFILFRNKNEVEKAPFKILNSKELKVGVESFHNGNFKIKGGKGQVEIGSYCAFGENIKLIKTNHNYNYASIQYTFYRNFFKELPYNQSENNIISIGNDVWIGDDVIILPNVQIGNGVCIAAGSIVTKDVSSYTIVAGVPAKEIKKRFSKGNIEFLENLKWWEFSKEEILNLKPLFFTDLSEVDSIEELLNQKVKRTNDI